MPELPAMENFRRSIEAECIDKKVNSVKIKVDRVVRVKEKKLSGLLTGQKLSETSRHGKYVFIRFGNKKSATWLAFHCGMTGYFTFPLKIKENEAAVKAKIVIGFTDGSALAFFDSRRFGSVELILNPDDFITRHALGIDGLQVDKNNFISLVKKSRKPLKGFFLDQSFVAGIGNVYGDEIPYQAKIDPNRPANGLTEKEAAALFSQFGKVLQKAIAKKAYLDHWDMLPKTWLVHYREDGAACPRCKGKIKAYTIGGRHGFWCPGCQK